MNGMSSRVSGTTVLPCAHAQRGMNPPAPSMQLGQSAGNPRLPVPPPPSMPSGQPQSIGDLSGGLGTQPIDQPVGGHTRSHGMTLRSDKPSGSHGPQPRNILVNPLPSRGWPEWPVDGPSSRVLGTAVMPHARPMPRAPVKQGGASRSDKTGAPAVRTLNFAAPKAMNSTQPI